MGDRGNDFNEAQTKFETYQAEFNSFEIEDANISEDTKSTNVRQVEVRSQDGHIYVYMLLVTNKFLFL